VQFPKLLFDEITGFLKVIAELKLDNLLNLLLDGGIMDWPAGSPDFSFNFTPWPARD
jgi:hypothetical protein